MKEDSTFLLSESTGWIVDWAHPAFEICRDKRRGSTYGKITYTVTKDPGHDWKAFARNLFEQARLKQASRILKNAEPSEDMIKTLVADDFTEPERKIERRIGFAC